MAFSPKVKLFDLYPLDVVIDQLALKFALILALTGAISGPFIFMLEHFASGDSPLSTLSTWFFSEYQLCRRVLLIKVHASPLSLGSYLQHQD